MKDSAALHQCQVFQRFHHGNVSIAEKAGRNSDHPNTKISHRLRNDKCVGFGAKLTLTADEEDDKSIYNNRDDAEEPAENPNHIYIVLNYTVVFASELFCCLLTTPFTADEEDDKSIYNHRNDVEGPAENQKPCFHRISF